MTKPYWSHAMPPSEVILTENETAPDLRCRILVNAERLFKEIGYRKTTVADIAHALRMSAGNIYRFFPSKMAINEAVADRMLQEIVVELTRIATDQNVGAGDRLRALIIAQHHMSKDRFTDDRRMHEMVEVAMAESWAVVHTHIDAVDRIICALVADGVRSNEFQVADSMVSARCVHSAVIRFCHPALITQCADEVGPTIDEMADFILSGLRYQPSAARSA